MIGAIVLAAGLAATPCLPSETRERYADTQRPAFANQTRACAPPVASGVRITTFATGLNLPWGVEVLPDGRLLVTERRENALRVVMPDGRVLAPITGLPAIDTEEQGGLLDVAVKPRAANDFTVCISFAEKRGGGLSGTSVACGRATGAENLVLEDLRVIFRQQPAWRGHEHFGSRLVFAPDGTLFITLGERADPPMRTLAQNLSTTLGKVVRVNLDGTAPQDNPFVARGGEAAFVWTYGHRNMQAAALRGGELYTVEHGPAGGDEFNHERPGRNYGWPVITYGLDYSGRPIGAGITQQAGMEQPLYYWDPAISPSALLFHSGRMFPAWRDNALIGSMQTDGLVRLVLDGDRVVNEERIPLGARVRDVAEARDGSLYVSVDSVEGSILRVTAR